MVAQGAEAPGPNATVGRSRTRPTGNVADEGSPARLALRADRAVRPCRSVADFALTRRIQLSRNGGNGRHLRELRRRENQSHQNTSQKPDKGGTTPWSLVK